MPTIPRRTERLLSGPKAYLGALGATIAWHLALLAGSSWWSPGAIVLLALLPALFLVVWAAASPVAYFRRAGVGELEEALERDAAKGNPVLLHFGSTVVQLVIFTAVWLAGALWVFGRGVGVPNLLDLLPIPVLDWFVWMIVRVVLNALVALALLAAVIQCAYLTSRLSDGGRPFLLVWSGLMLAWGAIRALPHLTDWLAWLPELSFQEFVTVGDGFELRTVYYESSPYAAALVVLVVLLVASSWLYRVVTGTVSLAPAPEPATPASQTEGGSVRRVLALNERILIILAALSLVFVYDVIANYRTVREELPRSLARRVVAYRNDQGFTRGIPFVASEGRIDQSSAGVDTILIKAPGDVRLQGAQGDTIAIDYTLRTFAESARAAEAYHELVDVITLRDGSTLEVLVRTPPAQAGIATRVRYDIALPRGVHAVVETEDGLIEAHGLADGLTARLHRASLRATEVAGRVSVESVDGDVWLTSVDGDVSVNHRNGRVEVHGVRGNLEITGEYGTFESSDVRGNVKARLTRSVGRFARLDGDLAVEGLMARIQADGVTGTTTIQGVLSPIVVRDPLAPITVKSDRGNVTVQLDPSVDWRLQLAAERGAIHTSLPDQFATSKEAQRGSQRVTAVRGSGATVFQGEVRYADLSVAAASR